MSLFAAGHKPDAGATLSTRVACSSCSWANAPEDLEVVSEILFDSNSF